MLGTNRVLFLNTFFDNVSLTEVLEIVDESIETEAPGYMVSLNMDYCIRLDRDACFREAYESARLALIDSQPLMNLAIRKGIAVKEKLSGSDLMPLICEHAAEKGYSCFFFGGKPGVPQAAAANMKGRYPGLKIAGCFSPDYGFEKDVDSIADTIARISLSKPDILFVCLGMPKSEIFLHRYFGYLDTRFAFSVGAAVDFAAGNVKRAPKWMRDSGFEWLFRFSQEPKRLFKRYFIESWRFLKIYAENRGHC